MTTNSTMAELQSNASAGATEQRVRKALILTASAGAGHLMAADALRAAFEPYCRSLEIVDVLQLTNAFFRRLYANGYLALVNHAPTAMGWLYEATDRPDREWRDGLRLAFQNLNSSGVMRYLIKDPPDLIVNTHFLAAEIVAHLRRKGQLTAPQVTVTTDFETHRLWVHAPTERYYTATEDGRAYLIEMGAPADRVHVTGIPVRPPFLDAVEQAEARRRLGLAVDPPTVLLLCGGFGVGPTHQLFQELTRTPAHIQLVVNTGRNERLKQRLEGVAKKLDRKIVIIGYTKDMHLLMRAADLAVTKPGGLTASEALTCGLPLVIMNPIPGQEARNSDYLLENGAAIKVNNRRLLAHRVARLLAAPEQLERLRRGALALARPNAAETIVADTLEMMRTHAS